MPFDRVRVALSLALVACFALGCTSEGPDDPNKPNPNPNPDPDPDPDPSFWLVGDGGSMFGVTLAGEASTYPLEHQEDLRAIACFGERTAWVVGDSGTLLRTRDAGRSWDSIITPDTSSVDWRALAPAEATLEGAETVWFVGRDGAVARTTDGGQSFTVRAVDQTDFSGVATTPSGEWAIAVAEDGGIWQLDADGRTLVYESAAALASVAMIDDELVAVGDGGLMLHSIDAGLSWATIELPTTHSLHAVRLGHAGHAGLIVAVGDAGVVVRVEDGFAEAIEQPDAELGLYGLHLRHDGFGQAVGANGALLLTHDAGLAWDSVALPTSADLRSVDDFHPSGHL